MLPLVLYAALFATPFLYLFWRIHQKKAALRNIRGPQRSSWIAGCLPQIFDPNGWKFHHDIATKYGGVVKIPMLLGGEWLYVSDPLAMYHMFIKEQDIYEEERMFLDTNSIVFGMGLLSTLGDHHRRQRKILNPVFSMKHMRDLIPTFYSIAYDLRDVLAEKTLKGTKTINVMRYISDAALDYIGQGGFGHSFNALHDNKSSEYAESIKRLPPLFFATHFHRQILPYLIHIGSPVFRRKVLQLVPSKIFKEITELVDVLDSGSRTVYNRKKKALQNGYISNGRTVGMDKDILSVLLKANMAADEKDRLPEEEILGQVNTFILAGLDTSSHALTRIMDLLSIHPHAQTRIREEVIAARKERGGVDLDYDTLMNLPYLDAVVRESLRLNPPVPLVIRTTRKDVIMPLASPILGADGKLVSEIAIKEDTNVIVSIHESNRNKKVWGEDAEEWKPERWLNPLPESVTKSRMPGIYSYMMTFIGGNRACIGFKFSEMEIKVVLAVLLEAFEFSRGPEVEWSMKGIVHPFLKEDPNKAPQLPLKTTLLNRA